MGDCIKQARAFVQCCQDALERANDAAPDDITDVLAEIQSGAKLNRARAIYRAAQDAIHCLRDEDRLPTRLYALSNVVSLYETGLIEMEQVSTESDHKCDENAEPLAEIIHVDFTEAARLDRAVDAIKTTLPFADETQKTALETLMTFTGQDTPELQDTPSLDDTFTDDMTETIDVTSKKMMSRTADIPLESFIREIIQNGLSVARQSKLTLSLSYDMGGVTLSSEQADTAKMRTEAWLACLIRHLAVTSAPNALNHIDLSATQKTLTLRTSAAPLGDGWQKACDHAELVAITHDAPTNTLTLNLALGDTFEPAMPKMPVEEGIHSRLAALLETTLSDEFSPDNFRIGAVT